MNLGEAIVAVVVYLLPLYIFFKSAEYVENEYGGKIRRIYRACARRLTGADKQG